MKEIQAILNPIYSERFLSYLCERTLRNCLFNVDNHRLRIFALFIDLIYKFIACECETSTEE